MVLRHATCHAHSLASHGDCACWCCLQKLGSATLCTSETLLELSEMHETRINRWWSLLFAHFHCHIHKDQTLVAKFQGKVIISHGCEASTWRLDARCKVSGTHILCDAFTSLDQAWSWQDKDWFQTSYIICNLPSALTSMGLRPDEYSNDYAL